MSKIIQYLDDHKIAYKMAGKNVTSGWIEISCLWCFDPSFHLGINLTSGFLSCWIGGPHGHLSKLVKETDGISWEEAEKLANELLTPAIQKEKIRAKSVLLPKEAIKELPDLHQKYLISRNYNPNLVSRKYNLYACYLTGDYAYRLIIPTYSDKQLITFTSRDVTGQQKIPYKNLSDEKSIVSVKDSLYNIDTIKDKTVIVEGVFDVWRIGNGATATFGIQFTHNQIYEIARKKVKKAIILFDYDQKAREQARKLGNILSLYISEVEVWDLDRGDPDTMTETDLKEVRRWLR